MLPLHACERNARHESLSDSHDVVFGVDLLEAFSVHLGDLAAEHVQIIKRCGLSWTSLEIGFKLLLEKIIPIDVGCGSRPVESAMLTAVPWISCGCT